MSHLILFVELLVKGLGSDLSVVRIRYALFLCRILAGICVALPDGRVVDVEFV